ncbi:hypothetical protein [Adhaeribacter arboris]|nr:hypothetical protein [Adhaeribacter arboris]
MNLETTQLNRKDVIASFFAVNEQLENGASLDILVKLLAVQTRLLKRLVILDKELILAIHSL